MVFDDAERAMAMKMSLLWLSLSGPTSRQLSRRVLLLLSYAFLLPVCTSRDSNATEETSSHIHFPLEHSSKLTY